MFVLVAPHIFCLIFKTKKSEICRKTPELWSGTYIHTDKVTWLFFSAYAIISFALRARNKAESELLLDVFFSVIGHHVITEIYC
jgi:hypothetical protein